MKLLKTLIRFLGSVRFAILLIATTALFVIFGTFIESWTSSHRFAAQFTYGNPVFLGLLCLFFVNILVSALRRWPFQRRHIPFLMTHCGLLMVIAGTLIKNIAGIQGNMTLLEGGGSSQILIPDTYVLHIEKAGPRLDVVTAEASITPQTSHPFPELSLEVLDVHPHAERQVQTWIKEGQCSVSGTSPFPIGEAVSTQAGKLSFHQDETGATHLTVTDARGRSFHQEYSGKELGTIIVYDRGFGGYAVQAEVPVYDDDAALEQLEGQLRSSVTKVDDLAPPLQLIYTACAQTRRDFPKECVQLLRSWDETGTLETDLPLDWSALPPSERRACAWISTTLGDVEPDLRSGRDLVAVMRERQWPLADDLAGAEHPLTALAQQVYSVAEMLPPPEVPATDGQLLAAYLVLYGIQLQNILPASQPTSSHHLETSIAVRYTPLDPTSKLEDNLPIVTVKSAYGPYEDTVTLEYDRAAQGLKWPLLGGRYRLSFQPHTVTIPHHVRLRRARQVNYPNSTQPYSFEADVIIDGNEKTISMNNVYEARDGTRFYLSGMSPGDESAPKHVQIVVNRDPAKYFLTYPGALLVALGTLLIFWMIPKQKR